MLKQSTKYILAFILCILPWSSMGKVKYVMPFGFIIENQVQIHQPANQAWNALVNHVDDWWPSDHTWWGDNQNLSISAVAGGCFCEIDGDKQAEHMRIVFVEPGKLLRMSGGLGPLQGMGLHGALDWTFTTEENKTTVTLRYQVSGINKDGFTELAPIVDRVQASQLSALKQFINNHH